MEPEICIREKGEELKEDLCHGKVKVDDGDFKESSRLRNIHQILISNKDKLVFLLKAVLFLAYISYVGYAFSVQFGDEGSIRLLVCSLIMAYFVLRHVIKKKFSFNGIFQRTKRLAYILKDQRTRKIIRWCLYTLVGGGAALYTVLYSLIDHPENLVSLAGIVFFVLVMYVTSTNRHKVKWHTVYWGLLLQLIFGIIFISTEAGVASMKYTSQRFEEFSWHADAGAVVVFGPRYKEFHLLFQVMPRVLIFIIAIQVLQYIGVISYLMNTFGNFLAYCLCTKPAESLVAASNTVLGFIESYVAVRPYLDSMSQAELFSLLVSGMATTAGDVLIFFSSFGAPISYMLTASVLSAPAALVCAKLNMPEEDDDDSSGEDLKNEDNEESKTTAPHQLELQKKKEDPTVRSEIICDSKNLLEAITKGGEIGAMTITSIIVSIITYLALAEFLNTTMQWFGERINVQNASFEKICSYALWPIAFLLGIPSSDCFFIGRMIGVRGFVSVALAYIDMGKFVHNRKMLVSYETAYNDSIKLANGDIFLPNWNNTLLEGVLEDRSIVIGTYALCGFSCLLVFGQILGIFAVIAPKRLNDVTKMIVRAFFISTIASFLTACIAGLLFTGA